MIDFKEYQDLVMLISLILINMVLLLLLEVEDHPQDKQLVILKRF